MYKVANGALHHKGKVYRKGDSLPGTFTNKEGYRHVEWKGKGTGPSTKDKVAENATIKKLQKENAALKAEIIDLEAKLVPMVGLSELATIDDLSEKEVK